MIAGSKEWYKTGWFLDIKEQSWTENTMDMEVFASYSDFYCEPASSNGFQLMVCSAKKNETLDN